MNIVAMNVRNRREKAQLSINQLADRSGVSKGTVSRIEAGNVPNVGVETLTRLAKAMGFESPAVFFEEKVLVSEQERSTGPPE